MVILSVALTVAGFVAESVTFTPKLDVPGAVGVPKITPVAGASESPAGMVAVLRPFVTMLHVYGGTP
jgi:hypothetical protein